LKLNAMSCVLVVYAQTQQPVFIMELPPVKAVK